MSFSVILHTDTKMSRSISAVIINPHQQLQELKASEMEVRTQIHTFREKMSKTEHRNKHQIKVLEKLTEEHKSSEEMKCHYRISRSTSLKHMEGEQRQAAAADEVKSWCGSKIQNLEVRVSETRGYRLLRPPSVHHSGLDTDPERVPRMSFISAETSSPLATYVNILPSPAAGAQPAVKSLEFEDSLERRYFEMKLEASSEDYDHLKGRSISKHKPLSRSLSATDPQWQGKDLQSTSRPDKGSNSGSSPTASSDAASARRHWRTGAGGTVATLEVVAQGPVETHLRAAEVTQRFFETVSVQLESWYGRKIREAQRDRDGLLRKISALEEQLLRLRVTAETKC